MSFKKKMAKGFVRKQAGKGRRWTKNNKAARTLKKNRAGEDWTPPKEFKVMCNLKKNTQ